MAELPWHEEPPGPVDLRRPRECLDAQHHGLEKAKERILEYLAVRARGGKARGVVLCLAGPPGVGKTTLARRVAVGLGREFGRVSLGGIHDECEIRGHRMSFLASAPGRIIREIQRIRSRTAVLLLDEIDKIGADSWRSPAAALLEVVELEGYDVAEVEAVLGPRRWRPRPGHLGRPGPGVRASPVVVRGSRRSGP